MNASRRNAATSWAGAGARVARAAACWLGASAVWLSSCGGSEDFWRKEPLGGWPASSVAPGAESEARAATFPLQPPDRGGRLGEAPEIRGPLSSPEGSGEGSSGDDTAGGELPDAGGEPSAEEAEADAAPVSPEPDPVEPEPDPVEPPAAFDPARLIGWASVPGLGLDTTTGGGAAAVVSATTAEQLVELAEREEPLVIEISGTIRAPRVQVSSNKTLVGLGPDATLEGGLRIRGQRDEFVQNVIVRNLRVNAAFSDVDGDGVQIHYAHHVWVDHCEVFDAADGNLDVVHGSDFVTIGFTKFYYGDAAPDPGHRFSSLIGHSDSESAAREDTGRLKVTFHHNWWAENVTERMPRVRFGDVHLLNNYYSSAGNNYAVRAALGSRVLIEANLFEGVNDAHEINNDEGGPAQVLALANEYVGTSGARDQTGVAFEPPYPYEPTPTAVLSELVRAESGTH